MEMSIVNLVGVSVDGTRASLLPTLVDGLRPRAFRAVTGDAPGGAGSGRTATGVLSPSLTFDPTLDVTSAPTG